MESTSAKSVDTANIFKIFDISKPYYGFADLQVGNYEIISFKFVQNKWYDSEKKNSLKRILMVELSDQVLFLPAIFAKNFNDDDAVLEAVNNDKIKRFLCYRGKNKK